jgi:hypothetical protein
MIISTGLAFFSLTLLSYFVGTDGTNGTEVLRQVLRRYILSVQGRPVALLGVWSDAASSDSSGAIEVLRT